MWRKPIFSNKQGLRKFNYIESLWKKYRQMSSSITQYFTITLYLSEHTAEYKVESYCGNYKCKMYYIVHGIQR